MGGGVTGTEVVMEYRLVRKIEKAGATSKGRAITFDEAKLDIVEQYWLDYFAGVFIGKIKKTKIIYTTFKIGSSISSFSGSGRIFSFRGVREKARSGWA